MFKKPSLVFISPHLLLSASASPFINSPPKSSTRHKRQNARFYGSWIDVKRREKYLGKQDVSASAAQTAAHLFPPASQSVLSGEMLVFVLRFFHQIHSLTPQLWLGFLCLRENRSWRATPRAEKPLQDFFSSSSSSSFCSIRDKDFAPVKDSLCIFNPRRVVVKLNTRLFRLKSHTCRPFRVSLPTMPFGFKGFDLFVGPSIYMLAE